MKRTYSKETACVRAGTIKDPLVGGVRSPLFPSTSCSYLGANHDFYPRHGNLPNQTSLAQKLAEMEHGDDALVVGSGTSAIALALTSTLHNGDHLVVPNTLYSGAMRFITRYLPTTGIAYTIAKGRHPDDFVRSITPNTKAFYFESPTNPLLSLLDIEAIATTARRNGIVTVFDNTIATPINQNPLDLGVDIVVHSATKFLGGHGDLSGGVIVGARDFIDRARGVAHDLGYFLDPSTCHLLERSLQTLSVRIERSNANAIRLAEFLSRHQRVARVYYPGLADHPFHAIARKQMSGFGGVVSFELQNGIDPVQFQKRLELIIPANSLGEVVSTLNCPALASSSYASLSADQKLGTGVTAQLIRMSVGIESFTDLRDDLDAALCSN